MKARLAAMHGLVAVGLSGCVSLPSPPADLVASNPLFSPENFFDGQLTGRGTVTVILKGRHAVRVHSVGRLQPNGTLMLSQSVDEEGKARRERVWSIRQVSPGRYAGTLSDAVGPVTGRVDGNMLHLRFRMAGGLTAEQRLYLRPDGRTVLNRMTVRELGVVVAVLHETIRKVG